MQKFIFIVILLSFGLFCAGGGVDKRLIDLSGTWKLSFDGKDWDQTVVLPGSLTTNGLGDEISLSTPWVGGIQDSSFFKSPDYSRFREEGNIRVPFWLQPTKYYRGTAKYSREVLIPEEWQGKKVELELERCHWISELTVDGESVGKRLSLSTPHSYDLTRLMPPGRHTLTLTIDNSIDNIDPGENSHSISDHTQGNWNGVVGRMFLRAKDKINISDVKVFPDGLTGKVRIETYIENATGKPQEAELKGKIGQKKNYRKLMLSTGKNIVISEFLLDDSIPRWDEFNPALLTLEQEVTGGGMKDEVKVNFGLRTVESRDGEILLNGRPLFLRGTLDCAVFPITGYPPTEEAAWDKIFDTLRAYGLNHVRFHSWCPPEAAFSSADRKGFYLQIECGSWANQSTSLGDGKPIDSFIADESNAIVDEYGNHPSFLMMTYGNEPTGAGMVKYLTDFVEGWKNRDSRRLYSAASGWPNLPESQFLVDPSPRIQGWGQGLRSVINANRPAADFTFDTYTSRFEQPIVSHEIGQWCAYPNFKEMDKYKGIIKPRNMEIFQTTLKDAEMGHFAEKFLLASGKLQTLCYKADIEAALRTKDMDGFQLLGIEDFPGQGSALVGVLDAFYEPKGYVTGDEFSRFCNSTVPLAHLPKMIFTTADTLKTVVSIAHFGNKEIADTLPAKWQLRDTGENIIAEGNFTHGLIPTGERTEIGIIETSLGQVKAPAMLNLEVSIGDRANDWNLWVYPQENRVRDDDHSDIMLTDRIDEAVLAELAKGGKVFLSIRKGEMTDSMGGDVKNGFSSIFWNTAWTARQAPHTLGILVDPDHRAFSSFPTSYHSDYQWWDAMTNSSVVKLDMVAPGIEPIVRVIDDWFTNRPLGLVFEVESNGGKLLVSGIDFWNDMENRPEGRQLLKSLQTYMDSQAFNPSTKVDIEKIAALINISVD